MEDVEPLLEELLDELLLEEEEEDVLPVETHTHLYSQSSPGIQDSPGEHSPLHAGYVLMQSV